MTASLALDTFRRLIQQVEEIEAVAVAIESTRPDAAPVLRRSAYVLAVAAIDTYFHEQAARLLWDAARAGSAHAARVANYLQSVSASDVSGPFGEGYIRMRLSYRTLVAPKGVDAVMTAWGADPDALWRSYCFASGTRPDRERRKLELFYDRRNQIAHEGDWDFVQLDFRPMAQAHLADCVSAATGLAEGFDLLI